ncbi:SLC13 family permease [Microbacterium sp. M3]|uniref:SLC13 family permease n=1 Tax=Microbacterium arthrosphaerae TaxID=792652 RepID=A0ABU4H3A5_9MICO|nr:MULTISPECIES: SLC13 family permease [Microbacterium]MDW4573750.1 SLC13 family permease [Microbacterium arthrosphaerae]MDW7607605.1 SLC13 family permease [Microbacterium sp. M3]
MDPVAATLVILVLAVVAFVSNRVPIGVVAIGVALALFFTGVLTLPEALAGFGDPTVLFIAALFVVSESLDATGVTAWAGQRVIGRAGTKRSTLVVVVALLVAGLTALISINGAVAALLPLVVVVAARAGIASSKLLLPLAFAASAGSLLLLTGTPVNILVSEFAANAGGREFGYFEFALVGVPVVLGTIAILLVGGRLVPERKGALMPIDLVRHARLLRQQYALTLDTATILGPNTGVTEVVVAPRSPLIGARVCAGMTTPDGDLVVLGARRGDEQLKGIEFEVQAGDALLLQGTWDDLSRRASDPGVLVVDDPAQLRRSVPLGRGAKRAIGILLAMIVLLATGLVPPAVAALLAACALVLTRTVTVTQAYHSISWTTVVLIAGMIPLSTAFIATGTADLVAEGMLSVLGDAGPHVALLALCGLTVVLGQLISNTATVLIVAPIAISVSQALSLSVQPFMMALTVAGAAAFLTPIATPANLMVMEPGGYRFGDYWKLGLPLVLFFLALAVFYVPLIWPF